MDEAPWKLIGIAAPVIAAIVAVVWKLLLDKVEGGKKAADEALKAKSKELSDAIAKEAAEIVRQRDIAYKLFDEIKGIRAEIASNHLNAVDRIHQGLEKKQNIAH